MKILETVVEFILGMIKRAATMAAIGAILLVGVWVVTVLMPEEALNALNIFKGFVSP